MIVGGGQTAWPAADLMQITRSSTETQEGAADWFTGDVPNQEVAIGAFQHAVYAIATALAFRRTAAQRLVSASARPLVRCANAPAA